MQQFGKKLRKLRKQRGLTLRDLAEMIGHTTHSHVSELETGKRMPSLELVIRISELFDVTIDQLVKDDLELNLEP